MIEIMNEVLRMIDASDQWVMDISKPGADTEQGILP